MIVSVIVGHRRSSSVVLMSVIPLLGLLVLLFVCLFACLSVDVVLVDAVVDVVTV